MTTELFDLSGKTALVTGGGTGIGQAIAHALSDAGAYLIVIGRREDKLKKALDGRDGLPIAVDLSADGPLTKIRNECESHGTFPDIIVNAAGLNPRKHADDVSQDVWNQTIHINLTVPFFLAQTFVPEMKKKQWGRIINIASLQSERAFTNEVIRADPGIPLGKVTVPYDVCHFTFTPLRWTEGLIWSVMPRAYPL